MRNLKQRKRLRNRRGNALLESALVLWPFMLIIFGIIQISFVIWSNSTLAYAVDASVRYATLNGARSSTPATADNIKQVLRDNALGLDTTILTANVTWTPNNRPGSTVRIEATYPIQTLISVVWNHPYSLKATSEMLILN